MGAAGINRLTVSAQNAVIGRGYFTTRIVTGRQNLNSGVLVLTVLPGRIGRLYRPQS
ncbi:POTRA domain-containing protein [Neisseria chenwenguii]|uniref:POTRA domain-containing protein n=1 Tax=Neisseria chenwenguii TaxID=1853278 RepID=UPI0012FDF210